MTQLEDVLNDEKQGSYSNSKIWESRTIPKVQSMEVM